MVGSVLRVFPQFEGVADCLQGGGKATSQLFSSLSTIDFQAGLHDLLLTHFKDFFSPDMSKKLDEGSGYRTAYDRSASTPTRSKGVSLVIGINQTDQSTN